MEAKKRTTRQGIRDLNYYGPRRTAVASAASVDDVAIAATPLAVPEVVAEQPLDQDGAPPFSGQ
jgi:hypothetical protein